MQKTATNTSSLNHPSATQLVSQPAYVAIASFPGSPGFLPKGTLFLFKAAYVVLIVVV